MLFLGLLVVSMTACGGGGGDDGGGGGGGSSTERCETQGGHNGLAGTDCAMSGCHATNKQMSYAGSAPSGTTITITEDASGRIYLLPVNSQGNFCLRSKDGGNPGGGYAASTSVPMIVHPSNGSVQRWWLSRFEQAYFLDKPI